MKESAKLHISTSLSDLPGDINVGSGDRATLSGWYSFQAVTNSNEDILWSTLNSSKGLKIARYKPNGAPPYVKVEVGYGGGSPDIYSFTDCTLPSVGMGMLTVSIQSSVGGKIKVYRNGTLCGTNTLNNSVDASSTGASEKLIMQAHTSSSYFVVDALGFWNTVLGPTAIARLYNDGAGKQYPF